MIGAIARVISAMRVRESGNTRRRRVKAEIWRSGAEQLPRLIEQQRRVSEYMYDAIDIGLEAARNCVGYNIESLYRYV